MGIKYCQTRLPDAYQEVEYIASAGGSSSGSGASPITSPYIDTGYKRTSNYGKTKAKFEITGGNSCQIFRGSNDGTNIYTFHIKPNFQLSLGSNVNQNIATKISGRAIDVEFTANSGSYSINIDGTSYTGSYTGSVASDTRNVYLFNTNEDNYSRPACIRIYYLQMYSDTNTLVRDFVPCYRKSDNEIGLYDLVGNQFYPNAGAGDFTKGNDINTIKSLTERYVYIDIPERQPGAHTLAYYPLTSTSTVNDTSINNKHLTNNGSVTFGDVGGVDCATFSGSNYLNRSESLFTGSATFTVNMWYKKTGNYASGSQTHINIFSIGTKNGTNSFLIWGDSERSSSRPGHLMLGGRTNDRDTLYVVPSNQWINIIVTHSGGDVNVYINNELQYSGTVSYGIQSGFTGIGCSVENATCIIGNLSKIIVEDTVWTEQQRQDYFDSTKSLYGLE